MAMVDHGTVWFVVTTVFLGAIARFGFKFYHVRFTMFKLRSQNLVYISIQLCQYMAGSNAKYCPGNAPWNPILGHLYFCYKLTSQLPPDAHPGYLPDMIRRQLPDLGPVYYLDLWPFGPQMLIVSSVEGLYQITQEHSLPKHAGLKSFLYPIADGLDLVTMEGDLWKFWRGVFNPGFSAKYLITLTRSIQDETEIMCSLIERLAHEKSRFTMKELTDNLTMDVIGRVVMHTRLDSQRCNNPLVDGIRMQVKWCTFGADINPFKRYNPVRLLVHWYNSRRMNGFVNKVIDSRFTELVQDGHDGSSQKNNSIIDLVLTTYLSENAASKIQGMDSTFKKFTLSQIKLFLFSGHDTTSSTVCYIFYVLATRPDVLTKVRAEHDAVIGPDSKSTSVISANPFLLNQLPYTIAVIKEVMRLYPAVSGTRTGESGFSVTDNEGRHFPTQDFLVWDNPQLIHRDPTYWHKPDELIPERWLEVSEKNLHPVRGAWRAFSHGPRSCIGQELAMMEMKIIMLMTARRFDLGLAYDELDQKKGIKGVRSVYGERGYQIGRAQPSENLPCYVTTRGE